jgi:hypothetical protein
MQNFTSSTYEVIADEQTSLACEVIADEQKTKFFHPHPYQFINHICLSCSTILYAVYEASLTKPRNQKWTKEHHV